MRNNRKMDDRRCFVFAMKDIEFDATYAVAADKRNNDVTDA
jgi:hypothetical protein